MGSIAISAGAVRAFAFPPRPAPTTGYLGIQINLCLAMASSARNCISILRLAKLHDSLEENSAVEVETVPFALMNNISKIHAGASISFSAVVMGTIEARRRRIRPYRHRPHQGIPGCQG